MNEKRIITERQEQAYRLCHHDFGGKTITEAAEIMGISQRAVSYLLNKLKKTSPQLFPILTICQKQVYDLWLEGRSRCCIAERLGVTESTIKSIINCVNKKFGYEVLRRDKTLSYDGSMDNNVKQKF